jgi:ribosomal-protein-alanine N-acetyltransferase
MTPADIDAILEIANTLNHAPHWPASAYQSALDPAATPRRIALVADDPHTGNLLGFTISSLLPPQAELETIAVAAASQRQGVARRLFAATLDALTTAQITDLLLEVRASNAPALAFYNALGFATTGGRPRYYADPPEDALLLQLRLGSPRPATESAIPGGCTVPGQISTGS